MAKLLDKIRNMSHRARKYREPVVGEIEEPDEMTDEEENEMYDSIGEEDEEDDGIHVMSREDVENLDNDEFEKFARESLHVGNRAMDKKRNPEYKAPATRRPNDYNKPANEMENPKIEEHRARGMRNYDMRVGPASEDYSKSQAKRLREISRSISSIRNKRNSK